MCLNIKYTLRCASYLFCENRENPLRKASRKRYSLVHTLTTPFLVDDEMTLNVSVCRVSAGPL